MEKLGDEYQAIYTKTPEIARLKFGFLMYEILDRINAKIKSTLQPDRTLWIYSGHDKTIASILNILGLYVSFLTTLFLGFEIYFFFFFSQSGHHSVRH